MALHKDVFLSLLALDAYNRGPGAGLNDLEVPTIGPNGNPQQVIKIGNAQISSDSAAILGPSAQAAGFYAIAYEWNGEKVISYRGTNFPDLDNVTAEAFHR